MWLSSWLWWSWIYQSFGLLFLADQWSDQDRLKCTTKVIHSRLHSNKLMSCRSAAVYTATFVYTVTVVVLSLSDITSLVHCYLSWSAKIDNPFPDGSYNGIKAAPDIEKQYKGAQGCYDLDECLVGALQEKDRQYIPHKCQPNSYCENTAGSYQCICDEGYEGKFLIYMTYRGYHIWVCHWLTHVAV